MTNFMVDTRPEMTSLAAKCIRAFMECDDEVQNIVREMVAIIKDPQADPDDQAAAMDTLAEALFPQTHKGQLGASIEELDDLCCENHEDGNDVRASLNRQESTFSQRLEALMRDRNMTQAQLAERIDVGQPAISMMLKRECRPQQRTIRKLAEVLGVKPDDLWPS